MPAIPAGTICLELGCHYSNEKFPNGVSGVSAGHEVDLVVMVKAAEYAQLQAGYGIFVPNAFVRNTGSHKPAHLGFMRWSCKF